MSTTSLRQKYNTLSRTIMDDDGPVSDINERSDDQIKPGSLQRVLQGDDLEKSKGVQNPMKSFDYQRKTISITDK